MSGRPRPPAARAIIYAAAIGNLTHEQANELLNEAGLGGYAIQDPSFQWIRRSYVPRFAAHPSELGEMIYHPKPVGDFTDR